MLSRYRKYRTLSSRKKRLLLQAFRLLGQLRFAILTRSFKRLVAGMQHNHKVVELPPLDELSRETANAIGWAIRTAARHTPWQSTCLVQVLAAQRMLRQRGISGAFFLGASKDFSKEEQPPLSAHAWLKCGQDFITGESGHDQFTVVSSFSWP